MRLRNEASFVYIFTCVLSCIRFTVTTAIWGCFTNKDMINEVFFVLRLVAFYILF